MTYAHIQVYLCEVRTLTLGPKTQSHVRACFPFRATLRRVFAFSRWRMAPRVLHSTRTPRNALESLECEHHFLWRTFFGTSCRWNVTSCIKRRTRSPCRHAGDVAIAPRRSHSAIVAVHVACNASYVDEYSSMASGLGRRTNRVRIGSCRGNGKWGHEPSVPCIPISHALARSSSGGSSERPRALAAASTCFWCTPVAASPITSTLRSTSVHSAMASRSAYTRPSLPLPFSPRSRFAASPSQNSSVFLMNATSQGASTTRSMEGVYAQSQ